MLIPELPAGTFDAIVASINIIGRGSRVDAEAMLTNQLSLRLDLTQYRPNGERVSELSL